MPMLRGFKSSGISGNDSGVYTGITGPLARSNNGGSATRVQYRPQLGGILLDPSSTLLSKRPSPDIDYQLARKQPRSNHSTWISGYSVPASDRPSPFPAYHQQQQTPSGGACEDSIRNRLQELERALLDDDDDGVVGHDNGGLESEIIDGSNDWKETMQSLLSSCSSSPSPPPAFSPSPPSASSSTSPAPTPTGEPKQLILDTLVALSEGRAENALAGLARARQLCNPRSGDPEQRLLAHMTRAIASRSNPPEIRAPGAPELSSMDHLLATQMLYEAPCFKLGFMAANLAILEAVRERSRIHIIDFDLGQGNQYATLIQALAERQSDRPASLRITAVVIDAFASSAGASGLRMVGDRLEKQAERYGLRFSFHVVSGRRVGELNRASLERSSLPAGAGEEEEAVVVNFAYRLYRVADESVSTENPRDEMLRLARGLRPVVVVVVEQVMNGNTSPLVTRFGEVVVVVEQVMNGNTSPLVTRFGEVVGYYRALIESLDATMVGGGKEAEGRVRVEECLGRRAANAVACEGWERVERCEVAGKWGARLGMAGFRPRPLGPHVHAVLLSKLRSYRKPGFTLKEDAGGLCFGWNDRVLTHASAWH